MGPPLSVGAGAPLDRPNSQGPPLAAVATSPIFPRAGRVSRPDKTLQEAPRRCPTRLDPARASSPVGGFLRQPSPGDPGRPRLLDLRLLVFRRAGRDFPHQAAPQLGPDRDFLHPFLHPRTAADPPSLQLPPEGGPRSPTTGPRRRPWEATGRLCPATCPPLLLPPATPSLLHPSRPPLPSVPRPEGARPPYRLADRAPLLSRPPRLAVTTTTPPACPRGTCRSAGSGSPVWLDQPLASR